MKVSGIQNNIIYTRLLAKFTYTQIISYWWLNLNENLFVNNCQSEYRSVQIKFWLDWKGCRPEIILKTKTIKKKNVSQAA